MAFARINGIVLHHELRGPTGRPVLAFSNSLGTDFRIWNKVATLLEDDFRLLFYDKRGHGLSEAPPQPYAMADHVNDFAALLNHLGIAQTVVIGVSVGGMIAQGIAAARPELVRGLVLSNTAHKIGTAEMWNGRIKAVNEQGIASIAESILQRWFTPAYCTPENPDYVGYLSMLTRQSADGYAGTCAALRDADLTNSAKALTVPVLCIAGDQDGSTPPDLVRELAALINGARLKIIENTGHLPCIEQPERTAELIRSFLEQAAIG